MCVSIFDLKLSAENMERKIENMERKMMNNPDDINYQIKNAYFIREERLKGKYGRGAFSGNLRSERGDNIVNNSEWSGLINDPNAIVLSSKQHYYYEVEELKEVKTVVNLMPLNRIRKVGEFLHSISQFFQQGCIFVGCFRGNMQRSVNRSDINSAKSVSIENDITSRNPFLNMIYSIIDSGINRCMTKSSVGLLLEEHGLKVIKMTERNGLTYFHARKRSAQIGLIA